MPLLVSRQKHTHIADGNTKPKRQRCNICKENNIPELFSEDQKQITPMRQIKQVQILFYFVTFYPVMYLCLGCYELARKKAMFSLAIINICNIAFVNGLPSKPSHLDAKACPSLFPSTPLDQRD